MDPSSALNQIQSVSTEPSSMNGPLFSHHQQALASPWAALNVLFLFQQAKSVLILCTLKKDTFNLYPIYTFNLFEKFLSSQN